MRITQHDLEGSVQRLNELTGNPIAPYTGENGKYKANIGNYHLDYAYGGVKLVRMQSEDGSITTISAGGYVTKRDLYNQIHTLINFHYQEGELDK